MKGTESNFQEMTSVQYPKRDFFWSVASFSSDVSFSNRLFRTLRLIENWLPRCLLMLGYWYTERLRRERRRSLVPCRYDRERAKASPVPSVGRLCISARLAIECSLVSSPYPQRKPHYKDGQPRLMMWSNFCWTSLESTCLYIFIVAASPSTLTFHTSLT